MGTTESRAGSIRLVGGRPCLDLLNTVSWRGVPGREQDHLADNTPCLVWCRRVGVLDADEAADLESVDVRRPLLGLRHGLATHLTDQPIGQPDLTALERHVQDALRHGHLVGDGRAARWQVTDLTAQTPARRVALDLLDLLLDPPGPLRRCDDPQCGWVFLDTSRGHRRRWCSSADCGNRTRVRRHAASLRD